ncbi:MAG: peptidase U32 family protein [Mycoplasmatales bacterium]
MEKINITPFNLEQIKYFNQFDIIDGFIIGSNKFGLRQVIDFDLDMIKKVRKNTDKKIYVAVNKLIHNGELNELKVYLKELESIGVDNVIFSDMGVYKIVKSNNLNLELTYNTETTITNQFFSEFAFDHGIELIELAKEITLKEIIEIAENKKSKISINIQGHLYMYQSVRKLIDNYSKIQKINVDDTRDYYLFDNERALYYPIVQNEQGTHLLSSVDVCMIARLDKILANNIDYFRIDGFGYKKDEYQKIVETYIKAIKDKEYEVNKDIYHEKIKSIVPHKSMGTGFYFKKTIY